MPSADTVRLSNHQLHEAIAVTARAFWPDPLFGYFARDSVREHQNMPRFVQAILNDAMHHGEVDAAISNGRVLGTASWLPLNGTPRSNWRELLIAAQCFPPILMGRNRLKAIKILHAIDKKHPDEPHVYLALLGVDPAAQGKGIGRQLLQPRVDQCDAIGAPIYLETQKLENLAYYERFGFSLRDTVAFEGCPTIWSMWRDPR